MFPNCPQRYCLRHIYANFQRAGFRGEELKKYMDNASYSYTKNGFDIAMANMKEESEEAWAWLANIPAESWARYAMDYNCKTDLVVNNLSEVFNRMILDIRGKQVKTMFDGIRTKLMIKYETNRTGAAKSRWQITPNYSEKLEEAKKWARPCKAIKSVGDLWQVTSSQENTYVVDLSKRTCGCRKWDLTGLPCHHAVAAIYKSKQYPEDFVHDFFKKPMYLEAYNPPIYPVPGEDAWTKTDTPDIDPPAFNIERGRAQTKRRKGQFEVPQPKITSRMASITCSNCKLVGHRYTSCSAPLRPSLQMRRNQHQVISCKLAAIYTILWTKLMICSHFICRKIGSQVAAANLQLQQHSKQHHHASRPTRHLQQAMQRNCRSNKQAQQAMQRNCRSNKRVQQRKQAMQATSRHQEPMQASSHQEPMQQPPDHSQHQDQTRSM